MEGRYHIRNNDEAYELIKAALGEMSRADDPYHYGVVQDTETGQQIVYFDLPRVSPLQFNIRLALTSTREEMVRGIKAEIARRLDDE
ncbi:MAG: hypothetical protein WCB68_10095 [Pyrinomonadaceae bacterium]